MTLKFADTHNMIAYLTKSDASEGFNQIIDFLNGSSIKYALTVNTNIYVLCIKQFYTSVAVKKFNDVMRLQVLVDKKKVIITEASIRDALRLDDTDCIECLPNEEIFAELARMGYEKPSTKLTFYKAVGKGFSGVETTLFEGMIVEQQFNEGNVEMNVEDVSTAGTAAKGDVSATDDVVPTAVEDHLFHFLHHLLHHHNYHKINLQHPKVKNLEQDKIYQDLKITKLKSRGRMIADRDADVDVTLKNVAADVKDVAAQDTKIDETAVVQGRKEDSQAQIYQIDIEHANKVLSMQDDQVEPVELQEVIEVVTNAKLITKVVTAASATITSAAPQLTIVAAPTPTTAPSATRRRKGVVIRDPKESATPSTIVHTEAKYKDKGKGILVKEPKPLKKQAQIEQDEAYARELEAELNKNIDWDEVIDHVQRKQKENNAAQRYQALKRKPQNKAQARKNMLIYLRNVVGFKIDYFKGMTYDDICPIFEKHFNSNVAFLLKTKEQMDEEDTRALKRLSES
nr:hypothetical protein [Tanacetum cinerariifolium]